MSHSAQIRAGFLRLVTAVNAVKVLANTKEPGIAAGGTSQYWRGDKTWRTLATDAEPPLPVAVAPQSGKYLRGDKIWRTLATDVSAVLAAIATSGSASDLVAGTVPNARQPARLGPVSPDYSTLDLNNAVDNGWYAAPAGAANSPLPTGYLNVHAHAYTGYGYCTQQAYEVSTAGTPRTFIRQQQGGTWGLWRETTPEQLCMPGSIIPFIGIGIPAGYIEANGQNLIRTDYPALFAAMTKTFACTTTSGNLTLTAATLDTDFMVSYRIGSPIEGPGIPAGTTILSIGSGTITMTNAATASATITARLLPFGRGNGSTFGVPLLAGGRVPIGAGTASYGLGATGGAATVTLSAANLPQHSHSLSTNGTHDHPLDFSVGSGGSSGNNLLRGLGATNATSAGAVENDGDHTHTVGQGPGTADAIDNMQPWVAVRYLIKT